MRNSLEEYIEKSKEYGDSEFDRAEEIETAIFEAGDVNLSVKHN